MPRLQVEVVCALPHTQERVVLDLPAGASAGDAAAESRLPERHGLADGRWRLGIGGREVPPSRKLRDGERLEILRLLPLDPREARRLRARRPRRRP